MIVISVETIHARHSTGLPMIIDVTYQHDPTSLHFSEFRSLERYLLQWITKPVHLTVRFECLTEQMSYYPEVHDFIRSVVKAQRSRTGPEWTVSVLGFDQQSHLIDVAA